MTVKLNEVKEEGQTYCISGRIVFFRDFGRLIFIKLFDINGIVQISVKREYCEGFAHWRTILNLGDIITVEGFTYKTKKAENDGDKGGLTLQVVKLALEVKCETQMPGKWHGIQNDDLRQRYRYIDFIKNETTKKIFVTRAKIIQSIREFLLKKDFIEVETPILHPVPSGASAKPFETHHNALNLKMFLRIAPEFYLKRFLVAGYNKVFEISKCFRNEGMDTTHLQEFTMLETYEAYRDYEGLQNYAIELLQYISDAINSKYDFKNMKKISYYDFLEQYGNLDPRRIHDYEYLRKTALKNNLDPEPFKSTQTLVDFLYKKLCVAKIKDPLLIYNYPKHPLAKAHATDPNLSQKIQIILESQEIVNAYMEQNDPKILEEEFNRQEEYKKAGDEEVFEKDKEFIEAMRYGMPPAAGFGLGIDRLVKILTNAASIRDIVFFPIMK